MILPKTLKRYADSDKARRYRNRQRKINYDNGSKNTSNGYKRWSESDERILMEYSDEMTDRQLSEILERSVRAIQIHRARMKKIEC